MQWRIVASLLGLAPAVILALRDGKLQRAELEALGESLVQALASLLVDQHKL